MLTESLAFPYLDTPACVRPANGAWPGPRNSALEGHNSAGGRPTQNHMTPTLTLAFLVHAAAMILLRRRARAWLARRHARIVAAGVARLEALVAETDTPTDEKTDPYVRLPSGRCRQLPVSGQYRVTLLFDAACAVRPDDDDDSERSPGEQIAKHRRELVGDRARE
jgi:hypothetical protein